MATDRPQSVHALVRLLKSSTDPPLAPGPSKIEIASLAWSDPSFRTADKGEVVGEWILTLLGQANKTRREKDANPAFDPIADSRYWTLLCAVLTTPPPAAVRPIKTWLFPLLNRFQVDTIVIELLTLQSPQVLALARVSLAVIWPLAEKKISIDALAECLTAVFNACTEWERVDDNLGWICSAVVATYKNALANAGNKKKLYSSFLNLRLSSWLCAICTSPSLVGPSSVKQLQDSIYAAGTDTLFSLDALKQPLDTLFNALSSRISSHLLVLPRLFTSFLGAIHRHRSALFVSATSVVGVKEEVRKKGMEFIERCWILIRGSSSLPEGFDLQKCESIIGILRIVEKERLFVRDMHTDVTKGEHGEELALSEARDTAVKVLETVEASSKDNQAAQIVLCIQLLDVLVQIEYDFIGSVLERVLSALINIPPSLSHLVTASSSRFLDRALEYHTKTRTVHTYALTLLDAVVASSVSSTYGTLISRSMASTFPLAYHLPAFARALRTTLTPTQTVPLATAALQAVESAWKAFKNAYKEEENSAKKRKVTEDTIEFGRESRLVPIQARVFSCTGRVSGIILSNLPANAYTKDEENSLDHLWGDVGKLGWDVIWETLREKTPKGHDTVQARDSKKRKHVVNTGPLSVLYPHVVTSAAFRFLYDVRARVAFRLGDCDCLGEAHVGTLLDAARDGASDPELVLEIIRTLLWHVWYTHNCESQKQMEIQAIFTMILDILATYPLSGSKWSGVSAALTRDNLGLAVLYVLTKRWIDVLDALASTESLEKFVSLLLAESPDFYDEDTRDNSDEIHVESDHVTITLRGVLLGLFRNAQFWELHNIRAVLLSSVLSLTAQLSPCCFPTAGVESTPRLIAIAHNDLTLACNVFSLLHNVPSEYFTRPVRTELVKRAMTGDVQICMELEGITKQKTKTKRKRKDKDGSDAEHRGISHTETDDSVPVEELKKWTCRLTFFRVFLQRMGQFLGPPSHSTSLGFVEHLLNPPSLPSPPKALTSVTLDLIQLHLVSLLRSQEPQAAASISSAISILTAAGPFSGSNSQETWAQLVVQSSVLRFIERTTGDFDSASLPDQVKRPLKTLLEALESALSRHARESVANHAKDPAQFLSSSQINAWSRMLSLKRWLGMNSQAAAVSFGLKLATSTIRRENSARLDSETCSGILGLLFEELWCMPDATHGVHFNVLVGFYAVNGGDRGSDIEHIMDVHVTQASKKMSVEDFSYLVDVVEEGIGGGGLRVGHRERLIHLGQVMLHGAPQGTFKIVQHFATRCFNLFAHSVEVYGGLSPLKLQCLEFIARHCSDRPAAIRSVDLSSIWSLLNKILSGSSEHDATTVFPMFQHIVTIIGALIRLRRDLVIHTLPHLGLVLRQLMMLIRKRRPQLGAKQSKMVTDTFPSWLSASQPLSTDEGRVLARLLTSLTAKTVPKTYTVASTESQKAESLAKPFAKHASYVLIAYVDAFNDPLCIINAEMRRELEPGLFALCEMVGEHSRDALMMSALDSGGKTILKSLWKEYEKQRYVGRG
ncbi:Urb2/Npa2 family-domain-containing protein [Boletus edulis BED1]|uniref:Urb2/Npa2 family-domain-containing protein n=1 Tax=Boletus edulis BED1 TaxID=1328754 RepID=A0AAD4C2F2_BOLED|nr:Urb2/Npa2 family-domain-containing protein [Boletus edulis BED1]